MPLSEGEETLHKKGLDIAWAFAKMLKDMRKEIEAACQEGFLPQIGR
jgi:hypothetical protein